MSLIRPGDLVQVLIEEQAPGRRPGVTHGLGSLVGNSVLVVNAGRLVGKNCLVRLGLRQYGGRVMANYIADAPLIEQPNPGGSISVPEHIPREELVLIGSWPRPGVPGLREINTLYDPGDMPIVLFSLSAGNAYSESYTITAKGYVSMQRSWGSQLRSIDTRRACRAVLASTVASDPAFLAGIAENHGFTPVILQPLDGHPEHTTALCVMARCTR